MDSIKSYHEVKDEFNDLWNEQTKVSLLGKVLFKIDRKTIFSLLSFTNLDRKSNVVDVGCGTGSTLKILRDLGYTKSIGIDSAESSISLCQLKGFKRGKDVLLIDVNNAPKKMEGKFDLVFSEGSIEHYQNIQNIVNSICKLSKRYVLTSVPDLDSLYWRVAPIFYTALGRKRVDDFNHKESEYVKAFNKAGFKLLKVKKFLMRSGWIMLFERNV